MGGRAAEELLRCSVTTGAANDLQRATTLARAKAVGGRVGQADEAGVADRERLQGDLLTDLYPLL